MPRLIRQLPSKDFARLAPNSIPGRVNATNDTFKTSSYYALNCLLQFAMNTSATDIWISATWEDYLNAIADSKYTKAKGYYYDHKMRIELAPVGHDHAVDHVTVIVALGLFTVLKQLAATTRDRCSYRKTGSLEVQPDVSYYVGENANVIPWGTGIVDLNTFPPPDLAIEVANTSLADDQGAKRLMYEDLGIKEYWILDVKNVRILAFEIINQGSHRIKESNVLPGLRIGLLEEALRRTRETTQSEVVTWLMQEFQRVKTGMRDESGTFSSLIPHPSSLHYTPASVSDTPTRKTPSKPTTESPPTP